MTATGAVNVTATGSNTASTFAEGGAVGAIAAGAMIADIGLGADTFDPFTLTVTEVDEVKATVGDNTTVVADSLTVNATGSDTLRSETVAASGGLVAIAGAHSRIRSNNGSLATIGENTNITVDSFSVISVHSQNFDSKADAVAFGLGAGTGAGASNNMNTRANVNIGVNVGVNDGGATNVHR